jgi:hypothetical protein
MPAREGALPLVDALAARHLFQVVEGGPMRSMLERSQCGIRTVGCSSER